MVDNKPKERKVHITDINTGEVLGIVYADVYPSGRVDVYAQIAKRVKAGA